MTWMYTALAIGIGFVVLSVILLIAYIVEEDDREIGLIHGFISFLLLGFMIVYLAVVESSHNGDYRVEECKGKMVINKFMTDDNKPLLELENGHLIEVPNDIFKRIKVNDIMSSDYCKNDSIPYAKKAN